MRYLSSNAYDAVPLRKVTAKLKYSIVKGRPLRTASSDLTDRFSNGLYRRFVSDFLKMKLGVFQGFILGSFLFIVLMNNIFPLPRFKSNNVSRWYLLIRVVKKFTDVCADLKILGWRNIWLILSCFKTEITVFGLR